MDKPNRNLSFGLACKYYDSLSDPDDYAAISWSLVLSLSLVKLESAINSSSNSFTSRFKIAKGAKVKICGSCADARGLKNIPLIEGTEISTMAELTKWVVESDKVVSF